MSELSWHEAREAIGAILDQIAPGALPEPTKIEGYRGYDVVWFGGLGIHTGYGTRRRNALDELLQSEVVHRMDKAAGVTS